MKKIDWFSAFIYGYVLINAVAVVYFIVVLIALACQVLAR